MNHIKDFNQLIGKTITSIPNVIYGQELIVKFNDNSFCIIQSEPDLDSNYHCGFSLKQQLETRDKQELEIITFEQAQKEYQEQALENAKSSLEFIKEHFPQLF